MISQDTLFQSSRISSFWMILSAYLAFAWILLQVAMALETTLSLPNWVDRVTLLSLALVFPAVLVFAWVRRDRAVIPVVAAKQKARSASLKVLPFSTTGDTPIDTKLTESTRNALMSLLSKADEVSATDAAVSPGFEAEFELGATVSLDSNCFAFSVFLKDAHSGEHLWAERFTDDVNADMNAQSVMLRKVAMQICAELTRSIGLPDGTQAGDELDSETCFQQGKALLMFKGWNPDNFHRAVTLFEQAIDIETSNAKAHAMLALVLGLGHKFSYFEEPDEAVIRVLEASKRALQIAPDSSEVLGYVGCAYSDLGREEVGIPILEKAIDLDAANAQAFAALGAAKIYTQQIPEGVADLERAIMLLPANTGNAFWKTALASGYLGMGLTDKAVEMIQQAIKYDAMFYPAWVLKSIACVCMGSDEKAKVALQQARDIRPTLNKHEVQHFAGDGVVELLERHNVW